MRYVRDTTPRGWYDDDAPLIPDVRVDEHRPVDTGLLWGDGSPIMRTPNPIGFGRDKEWY